MEISLPTSTLTQTLPRLGGKAAYTDTDTLQRPAPAPGKLPGSYTDMDVLAKGRSVSAMRPGSYADVHTMTGRKSSWRGQGRYTDVDGLAA